MLNNIINNPYFRLMRLHQPVGIFLLLWPCLIGLALASRGNFNINLAIVFTLGSILMRSAGCIINDLVDYKFDKQVTRTKNRPIASGAISKKNAVLCLALLLVSSFFLLFFLNIKAIIISCSSIILVIIYPFCKRFTYWPQLFLGITFNIGSIIAWVTVTGQIDRPAILLYLGLILWTVGYDTIYAHQDLKDDILCNVKSTAIKFGEKTARYLNWIYTTSITLIIFAGGLTKVTTLYYAMMTAPLLILFWQIQTLDINNEKNCSIRFKSNILVGGLIFMAALIK